MPDEIQLPDGWVQRKQVLTEADLQALAALLKQHPCQFAVTHDEMDDIKRMAGFFKSVERKIIDGLTLGFIALLGGLLYLLYNHGWFVGKK